MTILHCGVAKYLRTSDVTRCACQLNSTEPTHSAALPKATGLALSFKHFAAISWRNARSLGSRSKWLPRINTSVHVSTAATLTHSGLCSIDQGTLIHTIGRGGHLLFIIPAFRYPNLTLTGRLRSDWTVERKEHWIHQSRWFDFRLPLCQLVRINRIRSDLWLRGKKKKRWK